MQAAVPPGIARIADYVVGPAQPLLLIAGPCVAESVELLREVAGQLVEVCRHRPLQLVFKASYDKANRTSVHSYRGPGLADGLVALRRMRDEFGVPVTTDVHTPEQAAPAAEVCELLQIPAFLSRQTDLLTAAAATGRAVHVKKGQFMAPAEMQFVVEKLRDAGCRDILLGERGTFFGYGRLVNDMAGLVEMRSWGVPVVFDATHSVQQPGGGQATTGGNRQLVPYLARAAAAVGVDGLFLETHPDPDQALSDGPNMVPLASVARLLDDVLRVRAAVEPAGGAPLAPGSTPDGSRS